MDLRLFLFLKLWMPIYDQTVLEGDTFLKIYSKSVCDSIILMPNKIDIFQVTESQVSGLHKCDDCLQCLEFDQGQFLFVLTQFVRLWLVQTQLS